MDQRRDREPPSHTSAGLDPRTNDPSGHGLDPCRHPGRDGDLLGHVNDHETASRNDNRSESVDANVGVEGDIDHRVLLKRVEEQQQHLLTLSDNPGRAIGGDQLLGGPRCAGRTVDSRKAVIGLLDNDVRAGDLDNRADPGRFDGKVGDCDRDPLPCPDSDLGSSTWLGVGADGDDVGDGGFAPSVDQLERDRSTTTWTRAARTEPCSRRGIGHAETSDNDCLRDATLVLLSDNPEGDHRRDQGRRNEPKGAHQCPAPVTRRRTKPRAPATIKSWASTTN